MPERDLWLGEVSRAVAEKYASCSILDIGANVGDTAAIVRSRVANDIICVEPSDYYHPILVRNASRIGNVRRCEKALISAGSKEMLGELVHWGGTALFRIDENANKTVYPSKCLSEVMDHDTRLVKLDTDGWDYRILLGNIDHLARRKPIVAFESQMRSMQDFNELSDLCDSLNRIGYQYFIIWDDPGFHMISTSDIDAVLSLHRWMLDYFVVPRRHRAICNFDIAAFHQDDRDVYEACAKPRRN